LITENAIRMMTMTRAKITQRTFRMKADSKYDQL
jgi:hypothetical protein